jgi:hypothetical protein
MRSASRTPVAIQRAATTNRRFLFDFARLSLLTSRGRAHFVDAVFDPLVNGSC